MLILIYLPENISWNVQHINGNFWYSIFIDYFYVRVWFPKLQEHCKKIYIIYICSRLRKFIAETKIWFVEHCQQYCRIYNNYVGFLQKKSKAGTGPKGYYRCRQIRAINLGKRRLTRHRSALPANPTSSRPRSWSLGNATLVVAERGGWRRVLGASKPRPSVKGAHRYRKRTCLEALRLATTKLTQWGTGYPSRGHTTQLRISRGSTGRRTTGRPKKRWREQL